MTKSDENLTRFTNENSDSRISCTVRGQCLSFVYGYTVVMSWASCQIRKIADAHAPGMPGKFSPRLRVSDPDMHHGTCVTHVPWFMLGSLTNGFLWSRSRGKTFPAFPAHAQPTTLRIWKEAHAYNHFDGDGLVQKKRNSNALAVE